MVLVILKYIRSNFGEAEDLTQIDSEVQNDKKKKMYIAHQIILSYVNCFWNVVDIYFWTKKHMWYNVIFVFTLKSW